jgi:hypothetical protein
MLSQIRGLEHKDDPVIKASQHGVCGHADTSLLLSRPLQQVGLRVSSERDG